MQIYKRFNKIIDEYTKKEDVILTDTYISAYDLYHLIQEQLQSLKDINEKSSFIPKDYNLKIKSKIDKDYINLEFLFKKVKGNSDIFIRKISKDIKNNTYIFKTNVDKEFMNEFYDEITHIFDVKEKYYKEYEITDTIKIFSDSIFDAVISYNEYGEVNINVRINEKKELFKLSDRHWFLYNFILKKFKNRKIDILKKFPIEIVKIQGSMKLIVEDYFNNKRQIITKKKVE